MSQLEWSEPVVIGRAGVTRAEFDELRLRLREQGERLRATMTALDQLLADMALRGQRNRRAHSHRPDQRIWRERPRSPL
jgi:hypothetical protein